MATDVFAVTKIKTFNGREGQGLNATITKNGKSAQGEAMTTFTPQVLRDRNYRPFIVFGKGRTLWNAVEVDTVIKIVKLQSLRDLLPVLRNGDPYPARRAASFYLNRDHRSITKRAKSVLRSLVARKGQS
jgi:hypothetical protein